MLNIEILIQVHVNQVYICPAEHTLEGYAQLYTIVVFTYLCYYHLRTSMQCVEYIAEGALCSTCAGEQPSTWDGILIDPTTGSEVVCHLMDLPTHWSEHKMSVKPSTRQPWTWYPY